MATTLQADGVVGRHHVGLVEGQHPVVHQGRDIQRASMYAAAAYIGGVAQHIHPDGHGNAHRRAVGGVVDDRVAAVGQCLGVVDASYAHTEQPCRDDMARGVDKRCGGVGQGADCHGASQRDAAV